MRTKAFYQITGTMDQGATLQKAPNLLPYRKVVCPHCWPEALYFAFIPEPFSQTDPDHLINASTGEPTVNPPIQQPQQPCAASTTSNTSAAAASTTP